MKKKENLLSPAMVVLLVCICMVSVLLIGKSYSLSYKGHENDRDIGSFLQVYPSVEGSRLDDCQTCHRGGSVMVKTGEGQKAISHTACSYCHLLQFPSEDVVSGGPSSFRDTLNKYGMDYESGGRSNEALASMALKDSDGDGWSNKDEIAAGTYPGDKNSHPGKPQAPSHTVSEERIASMARHSQLILFNTSKEPFDEYNCYSGVRVKDLLAAEGIALDGVDSITFFAPDGYSLTFPIDEVTGEYPAGQMYRGLGKEEPPAGLGSEKGFVQYPPPGQMPAGSESPVKIPDRLWLMVALEKDRQPLEVACLDLKTGRLEGRGRYLLVVPQNKPGSPDRASTSSSFGDQWDHDSAKDHNAGKCIRALVAMRLNPMPEAYEEFDWKNGGYSLLEKKMIMIYGHGVAGKKTEDR